MNYPYYWRVRSRLEGRKGHKCRVLARSRDKGTKKFNSVLVEFEDGFKVVTSGWYIRKRNPGEDE